MTSNYDKRLFTEAEDRFFGLEEFHYEYRKEKEEYATEEREDDENYDEWNQTSDSRTSDSRS